MTAPEPVTPDPPRPVRRVLLSQRWLDVSFLHWPVEPGLVAPLLPPGTYPDVLDGASYVGLIPFMMDRTGPATLPGVPYLGAFAEANVRLYSVGADGRRGVVFISMEASRLAAVLTARAGLSLPYFWARMSVRRDDGVLTYRSGRRWPGPAAALRLRIAPGEAIAEPSPLEHFLTARFGLHVRWHDGRTVYLPNEHARWQLHRAALIDLAESLVATAGLPAHPVPPVSVLYSPGASVRFGLPQRLAC